ncbi:hypothetical protein GCM10010384_28470 [Streptomyces djakartensis]|uniref:VCBS repeat-containing protein n=1 Tax=Streptomyces djakartensis TaxID=68193 RepID=A0ABQ2ZMD1_9ACTN|nr:hypothetical protein GCM10010384_28470 [Streptomyces djakartensis]
MHQHERRSGRPHASARPFGRPGLRLALATAAALAGTLLTATAGTATAADSAHTPKADFNGDGIGDMAFSAPGASVSGKLPGLRRLTQPPRPVGANLAG